MECTTNFNRIRNNLQTLKLNEMDIHLSEYLDKLQSGDIDVTELIYELTKLEVEAKEIRAMNACVKVRIFHLSRQWMILISVSSLRYTGT